MPFCLGYLQCLKTQNFLQLCISKLLNLKKILNKKKKKKKKKKKSTTKCRKALDVITSPSINQFYYLVLE